MWDRISDVRIKLPNVTSNGMYRQKSPFWHIITAYRKQRILYRPSYHHHRRRCRLHHHHRCKQLGFLVARATKFPTPMRHISSIFITIVSLNTEATDSSQFHGSVQPRIWAYLLYLRKFPGPINHTSQHPSAGKSSPTHTVGGIRLFRGRKFILSPKVKGRVLRIIIIIIIIIIIVSFTQGIHTHIPETNHVPRG
jgi:hypothetical protein